MKFLQKATLAAAVAVAPFAAQAELKAMDDEMMSATTGQAGVTIDIKLDTGVGYLGQDNFNTSATDTVTAADDAAIQVGQVVYTDTKGSSDTDGGSVAINNIAVGTTDAAGVKITQTVDVSGTGQLVIGMSTDKDLNIQVGSVHLMDAPADSSDTAAVVGDSLASEINLNVSLGDTVQTIGANSTFTGTDDEFGGSITGVAANTMLISASTSVELKSSSLKALGGNVAVTGITFSDSEQSDNKAVIKQTMWADSNGMNIKLEEIKGDLTLGGIVLGSNGNSIGSVTVSDIKMAGVTQTIYGH